MTARQKSEQVAHDAFIAHYRANNFGVDVEKSLRHASAFGLVINDWLTRYKALLFAACKDVRSARKILSPGKARRLIAEKYNGLMVARVFGKAITLAATSGILYRAGKRGFQLLRPGSEDIPPPILRTVDRAILAHARSSFPKVDVPECLRLFSSHFARPLVDTPAERRAALIFAACREFDELLSLITFLQGEAQEQIASRYRGLSLGKDAPPLALSRLTLWRVYRKGAHRPGGRAEVFFKDFSKCGRRSRGVSSTADET